MREREREREREGERGKERKKAFNNSTKKGDSKLLQRQPWFELLNPNSKGENDAFKFHQLFKRKQSCES